MKIQTRHISTRLAAGPKRQSVDVILLSSRAEFREGWAGAFEPHMSALDYGDSIHIAAELSEAIAALGQLTDPVLVFDARDVLTWGLEQLNAVFEAAGPVSVVVAISEKRDPESHAELVARFALDDFRFGEPDHIVAHALLASARERLFLRNRISTVGGKTRGEEKLKKLNRIGVALAKERDFPKLLGLILRECRSLLDADAGSIYTIEHGSGRTRSITHRKVLGRHERISSAQAFRVDPDAMDAPGFSLKFAAAQNDSVDIPFREFVFPLDANSIAGFCALRGEVLTVPDAYDLPESIPYTFNKAVDVQYGYRCVSMLVIPMRNMRDEVVGVIQLINKKRDATEVLRDPARTPDRVLPFGGDDLDLATTLGNLAGTTIENVRLYDSINNLFESFVHAAVRAIDQRDPSTAGHSARVDRITLGIADRMNQIQDGPYASVGFTDAEMVELHYASILHDVGKIGVREHILTKANKLFPYQDEVIRLRAALIEAGVRLRAGLPANEDGTSDAAERIRALRSDLAFIAAVNKPGFMDDAAVRRLEGVRAAVYAVPPGYPDRLLTDGEFLSLSTRRGSLNADERVEMESHVAKSRKFLSEIPWTPELANVPLIAGQHHEKMNGKGYPDGIPAGETPLQSRIMAVADVFDSLTSSDRPYKPAIPLERACDILTHMAKDGDLDPQIVAFFIEQKMWERLNLKVIKLADANEAQRNAR